MCAHPCHDRSEKEEKAPPVALHVLFRQFDTNGKDADSKNDAGDFESDFIPNLVVAVGPAPGIEHVPPIGANGDSKQERPNGLSDVELCEVVRTGSGRAF